MAGSPFLIAIRDCLLVRRYSLRTIDTYLLWIKRYILFHRKIHPRYLVPRKWRRSSLTSPARETFRSPLSQLP